MSQPPITRNQINTGSGANAFVLRDENALLPIELDKISTGTIYGGQMSFGTLTGSPATTTKFSISAGFGLVIDNYTDPENPTYVLVTWPEMLDIEATLIGSSARTFILISPGGSPANSVIQQSTFPTSKQLRDNIYLGSLGHGTLPHLVAVRNRPSAMFDTTARFVDLANAIGPFNISGNTYGPNGSGLTISKTLGQSYSVGSNFHTAKFQPDITNDASVSTVPFFYSYRDGAGDFTVTETTNNVNPGQYDDGDGTLASVSTNSWTVQTIRFFPNESALQVSHTIEYGQKVYGSKNDALLAVPELDHVDNPSLSEGIIRCYLIVRGGASDLALSGDAEFVEPTGFGGSGGAVATFPGITDNATTEQITITDTETTFANRIDAEEVITEKRVSASPTTTYTADLTTGSVFKLTLGGDTSISFSNVPPAGRTTTVTFMLTQEAGSPNTPRTPSFPASVLWEGGSAPTWSTGAGETDIVTMFTEDGGTTWYANLVGQGYA